MQDIIDFPSFVKASGGDADTIATHKPGDGANMVLLLDKDGKIPDTTIRNSHLCTDVNTQFQKA